MLSGDQNLTVQWGSSQTLLREDKILKRFQKSNQWAARQNKIRRERIGWLGKRRRDVVT